MRLPGSPSFSEESIMRIAATVIILSLSGLQVPAQDPQVEQLRKRFAAARPDEKDLGIYRLDWVVPLKTARDKAVKDKRPLIVVAVRNEHGDTFTGHC